MKNPWLMKNPFMSMWLSGANALWGAARGQSMAAGKALMTSMMEENVRQAMRFWGVAVDTQATVPRKRRVAARKRRR